MEVTIALLDALNQPISDEKKIEYYNFFLNYIKNNLKKSEYSEIIDYNREIVDLVIPTWRLNENQLATLLGILTENKPKEKIYTDEDLQVVINDKSLVKNLIKILTEDQIADILSGNKLSISMLSKEQITTLFA